MSVHNGGHTNDRPIDDREYDIPAVPRVVNYGSFTYGSDGSDGSDVFIGISEEDVAWSDLLAFESDDTDPESKALRAWEGE